MVILRYFIFSSFMTSPISFVFSWQFLSLWPVILISLVFAAMWHIMKLILPCVLPFLSGKSTECLTPWRVEIQKIKKKIKTNRMLTMYLTVLLQISFGMVWYCHLKFSLWPLNQSRHTNWIYNLFKYTKLFETNHHSCFFLLCQVLR